LFSFENVNQSFSFYNLLAYGNELLYYEKEHHEQKVFSNKSMKKIQSSALIYIKKILKKWQTRATTMNNHKSDNKKLYMKILES
jgi:hypothetical protein